MERLEALVAPGCVAVVGASPTGFFGRVGLENLARIGFDGRVYAVNPRYERIEGVRCYPALDALPERPDAILVALSPERSVRVLEEAAALGVRAAVIPATAFSTMGDEGRRHQTRAAAIARESGMALLGPNGMGLVNLHDRVALYIGTLPAQLRPGPIGGIFQSGSICEALLYSHGRLSFSTIFSSGNEVALGKETLLEWLLDDPRTRVICLFVEGIADPDRFVALARRARALNKPLIVLKAGRSEGARRVAIGHTGAIAGSDRVFDAVCRQVGIVRVDSLDEMVECSLLFSLARPPTAGGVGALTVSGGQAALLLDAGEAAGLRFPRLADVTVEGLRRDLPEFREPTNPLDPWGCAPVDQFVPRCIRALGDDPGVNSVLLAVDTPDEGGEFERGWRLAMAREAVALAENFPGPVVIASQLSGPLDPAVVATTRDRVPLLQGTLESVRALAALQRYALAPGGGGAPGAAPSTADQIETTGTGQLTERESKRLLAAAGIPVVAERLATDEADAIAHARALGFPVALKLAARVAHKSELGAVRLDLADEPAVRGAYRGLVEVGGTLPVGDVEGVLVAPMIRGGIELILGMTRDPVMGAMILCGLGGVHAELFDDVVLRRPPIGPEEADAMLRELRGFPLLAGARGAPPRDLAAARDAILALSALVTRLGTGLREIDINPLLLLERGVVAVDALVVLE